LAKLIISKTAALPIELLPDGREDRT